MLVKTNNGKNGGLLKGKPHYDKDGNPLGGIKAVVVDTGKIVELEKDEVIINKEAVKKHWKELSKINQSAGNGVPILNPTKSIGTESNEYLYGGRINYFSNKFSDTEYKWKHELNKLQPLFKNKRKFILLVDLIQHKELFIKYPKMNKVKVYFEDLTDENIYADSYVLTNKIAYHLSTIHLKIHNSYLKKYSHEKYTLKGDSPEYSKEACLLHEIQHLCQQADGRDTGRAHKEVLVEFMQKRQDIGHIDRIELSAFYTYKLQHSEQEAMKTVFFWLNDIGYKYGNPEFIDFEYEKEQDRLDSQDGIYENGGFLKNSNNLNLNKYEKSINEKSDNLSENTRKFIEKAIFYISTGIRTAKEEQSRSFSENEIRDLEFLLCFNFAKENNLWIENLSKIVSPISGGGNENTLYYDEITTTIYKSNNLLNHNFSILTYLNYILYHNLLFEKNSYILFGFTGFKNEKSIPYIEPIISQNYIIDAETASVDDIKKHMESRGFERINDFIYKNNEYTVSDLRPRNVLKDKYGNIHVIDNIITLNNKIEMKKELDIETIPKEDIKNLGTGGTSDSSDDIDAPMLEGTMPSSIYEEGGAIKLPQSELQNQDVERGINSNSVRNWSEIPEVWKNTNEIKKINFVNSPYNKELIKILTPFTGTDPLRPIFSGVHFDKNGITCTDSHKLITLPYPNKDFNGTYATISKKYLADAKIKKDLFTDKKYLDYESVIPKASDATKVYEISLYKILQYNNVAQNYVNKATYQAVYSLDDTSIGFNSKFLTEIVETALKLGHKKLYAFIRKPNNPVVFSTSKNYNVGKDEIFLLMPTLIHTTSDENIVNGAFDLDYGRELLVYYDFSKDAIVNSDGSIAEFKMNYGEYDVIKSSDIKMLKDFGGKKPEIVLLENFKVDNGKIYASYFDRYNETFLTIKNIELKNGIYNVLDNAIEYNTNEAISGFEEFPNPKKDLGETKLKFILNSDIFTHYIKIAVDFTGNDELRPVLTGILLDYNNKQLFLVSTNAHIMFKKNITEYCEINKDISDFKIFLPKINLLKFLDNIDESPLVVTCTPNYIKFENDGYEFITKKIDGNYPAYNGVIPAYKSKKINVNIKDLFVCINSDEAKSFIKENPKTDIIIYDKPIKNNELDIYLGISNAENRYRESEANRSELKIEKEVKICTVNYIKEDGNFQMKDSVYLIMPMFLPTGGNFAFNVKYFREILEVCNTETLDLYYDEKNRAYIIQGDALEYGKIISSKKKQVNEIDSLKKEIESLKEVEKKDKEKFFDSDDLSKKTDLQLQTGISNFKQKLSHARSIITDFYKNGKNTIGGVFYSPSTLKGLESDIKLYDELLNEYEEELNNRKSKTKTSEVKKEDDFTEAISTLEMLIDLGGSKKQLSEWKEAIDTFKMLGLDDTEKMAKGGSIGVDLILSHNKEKAPYMGKRYGQDVEPSGYYAIEKETDVMESNPNYETVTFNPSKPLIIDITLDTLVSWKYDLSKKYKAKKQKLSEKLMKEGYDVIITKYENGDTGEIIVLDTSKIKPFEEIKPLYYEYRMAKGGNINFKPIMLKL